ncbi:coelenterazine h 2-monooxygenase-like [Diadema antillarum]|uniref:coelenterazine h 2-monooxygenase-like n=1 Tax=Diadema antillarum TaxID=105358 RepID=UPI003A8BBD79
MMSIRAVSVLKSVAVIGRVHVGRLLSMQLPATGGVRARHQSTIPLVTAEEWWGKCSKVNVMGEQMSYYDSDPGQRESDRAVVFLHGNPTSSYLWRNVVPQVQPIARCLAPDLIGMGRSNKLASLSYRFVDHYRFLSGWFDRVNLPSKVSIVCHDWGSALGFHWSNEHRDRLEALVHMESLIAPFPGWDKFPDSARDFLKAVRSEAGEEMVIEKNMFVEQLMPRLIQRKLRKEEMDAFVEPFKVPGEDRRPTLTWPREIPVVGDGPDDVIAIATAYYAWLKESTDLPKLLVLATPGSISESLKKGTEHWPNQKIVEVDGGLHFLQEDSPTEIGDHIKEFLSDLYK